MSIRHRPFVPIGSESTHLWDKRNSRFCHCFCSFRNSRFIVPYRDGEAGTRHRIYELIKQKMRTRPYFPEFHSRLPRAHLFDLSIWVTGKFSAYHPCFELAELCLELRSLLEVTEL